MNFESGNFNNVDKNRENSDDNLDSQTEEIELDLSLEDLGNLEILRNKIEDIKNSSYEKAQKFEEAAQKFLENLEDNFEEGELNKIAAVAFLKGEGISDVADQFDLGNEYSVMEFVDSFE
jgi:hypothetical protein